MLPIELAVRVEQAEGGDRWLDADLRWIGDAAGAANAIGGEIVSERPGEAWVVRQSPIVAIQLREVVLPDGISVWELADSVQPVPCDGLEE